MQRLNNGNKLMHKNENKMFFINDLHEENDILSKLNFQNETAGKKVVATETKTSTKITNGIKKTTVVTKKTYSDGTV